MLTTGPSEKKDASRNHLVTTVSAHRCWCAQISLRAHAHGWTVRCGV